MNSLQDPCKLIVSFCSCALRYHLARQHTEHFILMAASQEPKNAQAMFKPHLLLPVTNLMKARFCSGPQAASTCHRHCSTSCSLLSGLPEPLPAAAWFVPSSPPCLLLLLLAASSSSTTTLNTFCTSKSAESSTAAPHSAHAMLAPLKQQSSSTCRMQQRPHSVRRSTSGLVLRLASKAAKQLQT